MAEGARLESVFTRKGNVGSNPTLSAITFVIWHLRVVIPGLIPQSGKGHRFAIVYSATHPSRGGQVQHTFLLDRQTGDFWQMVCQKNGTVAFQETPRQKAP